MYRFEHNISTKDASMPDGRLSYVGLSGGFGTVTVGQIWSASYNLVGAITDNSWFWGSSQTTYRHGHAVSYAFSNDLMSLQIDAVYDLYKFYKHSPVSSNLSFVRDEDLERTEFGLSVNVGDIGKVAIVHVDDRNILTDPDGNEALSSGDSFSRSKTTTLAAEVSVSDLTAYIGTQTEKDICQSGFLGTGGVISLGPCTTVITKAKTTFFGLRGGLGDTGLSYLFQWRDVKDSHQPWLLSLTKDLGENAALVLEHVNYDGSPGHDGASGGNRTGVALAVHF